MGDFFKKRTTVSSRLEEVESLEPPTITICMDPPFKTSVFAPYKLRNAWNIFTQDFPNETLGQRFDKVSYKLGVDFNLFGNLLVNGKWYQGNVSNENNPLFDVLPIQTSFHGTCYKIQPNFSLTSLPFYLDLYLNMIDSLKEIDFPTKIIIYLTSNNTWQGVPVSVWPQTTPSKLELEAGSTYFYNAEQTEQLFEQGLELTEECLKTHIIHSNCTACQFASFANLPMCNSSKDAMCINNLAFSNYLWSECNKKKRFLNFNGEVTKWADYIKDDTTVLKLEMLSMVKEIKEEIDVITLPDLIGSVGGSLGMFFGFSISASIFYCMDKFSLKIIARSQ